MNFQNAKLRANAVNFNYEIYYPLKINFNDFNLLDISKKFDVFS